ncbi:hypothetical protein ACFUTU_14110 [Arthrobacter sp. NPDC057388]|uniref:hypothetical protein n=1 Tax=Arthrobacter sp. NPDC057388 TaxID=3346116 RepID=UPI00363A08C0
MNRPDSNSSDPSANQDDAVWLDLVARLQGDTTAPDAGGIRGGREPSTTEESTSEASSTEPSSTGPSSTEPSTTGPSATEGPRHSGGPRHSAAVPDGAAADAPANGAAAENAAKRFTDFDPLGLAPRAPRELSAAERQQAAEQAKAENREKAEREKADRSGHADVPHGTGDPRGYAVDDDEGEFVPEEPPKLSATDPLTMLAWLGAVGAPVALVLSSMFWRSAPLLAILGMVAIFVGAVVYLIMKLPQEKDENDDGARV